MTLDKSAPRVRAMFGDIAPRYDLLNHLLSGNQDVRWRRRGARLLSPRPGETILDLCCGTGDLTLELRRQQLSCRVLGADFALPMLVRAAKKSARRDENPSPRPPPPKGEGEMPVQPFLSDKKASRRDCNSPSPSGGGGRGEGFSSRLAFLSADALRLPFHDAAFDALSVAFGARNFADTRAGLREIHRVLRPGGRLLILEFMRPTSPLVRQFFGVFNLLLAPVGRAISGHDCAYNYLPQSVDGFYTRREFQTLLRQCGFGNVRAFDHSGGVATSFLARK